jgi:hypothetical protein
MKKLFYITLLLFLFTSISFGANLFDGTGLFRDSFEADSVGVYTGQGNCGGGFDLSTFNVNCVAYIRDEASETGISARIGDKYVNIVCTWPGEDGSSGGIKIKRAYMYLEGDDMLQGCDNYNVDDGTEYWFAFSFFLKEGAKYGPQGSSIFGIRTQDTASIGECPEPPGWEVNNFQFGNLYDPLENATITHRADGVQLGPYEIWDWSANDGEWVDVVVRMRWYTTDDSYARIWFYIDGVLEYGTSGTDKDMDGLMNIADADCTVGRTNIRLYNWWSQRCDVAGVIDCDSCLDTFNPAEPCTNNFTREIRFDEVAFKRHDVTTGDGDAQANARFCEVTPAIKPIAPVFTYPLNTDVSMPITFTATYSGYTDSRTDTQNCFAYSADSQIQIALFSDTTYSSPVFESTTAGSTSVSVDSGLGYRQKYRARVRHKSLRLGTSEEYWGDWSEEVTFTTIGFFDDEHIFKRSWEAYPLGAYIDEGACSGGFDANITTYLNCVSTIESTYPARDGSKYLKSSCMWPWEVGQGVAPLPGNAHAFKRKYYYIEDAPGTPYPGEPSDEGLKWPCDNLILEDEYYIAWSIYIPSDQIYYPRGSSFFQFFSQLDGAKGPCATDDSHILIIGSLWGSDNRRDGNIVMTIRRDKTHPTDPLYQYGPLELVKWGDYKGTWMDFVLRVRYYDEVNPYSRIHLYINGDIKFGIALDGIQNVGTGCTPSGNFMSYQSWGREICKANPAEADSHPDNIYTECDNCNTTTYDWHPSISCESNWTVDIAWDAFKIKHYPTTSGDGDAVANDRYCEVAAEIRPNAPVITYPGDGDMDVSVSFTANFGAYVDHRADPQNCFDAYRMVVEVDEAAGDWSSLAYSSGNIAIGTSHAITGLNLFTAYQMRVKLSSYNDNSLEEHWSNWSPVVNFTTGNTIFYVSQSGSDSDDGLSPSTPWKTLCKVNDYAETTGFPGSTTILLNKDDVWDGSDVCFEGIGYDTSLINWGAMSSLVFDAYGTGANPQIDADHAQPFAIDASNITSLAIQNINVNGQDMTYNYSGGVSNIYAIDGSNLTIDNVECDQHDGGSSSETRSQSECITTVNFSGDVEIMNSTFKNTMWNTLRAWGNVDGIAIDVRYRVNDLECSVCTLRVHDNVFEDTESSFIRVVGQTDVEYYNNTYNNFGEEALLFEMVKNAKIYNETLTKGAFGIGGDGDGNAYIGWQRLSKGNCYFNGDITDDASPPCNSAEPDNDGIEIYENS